VWSAAAKPRRHGQARRGHTTVFDQTVAWLASQTSKTAVTQLMRVGWRTVGAIVTRVWADCERLQDQFSSVQFSSVQFSGLRRRAGSGSPVGPCRRHRS
jgi:hypothetical protein